MVRAVRTPRDFDDWRDAARDLLRRQLPPEAVAWSDSSRQSGLLFPVDELPPLPPSTPDIRIPREFLELARTTAMHRNPLRWEILYRVAWRLTHGEPHLLRVETDDDVNALYQMRKAIGRDLHKMRAFVRFRRVEDEQGEHYIAWYEPQHRILQANARFFKERFATMRWSILTPEESLHWDTEKLHLGPGLPRSAAPAGDELEELWRTYYGSIFNPARLNLTAMRAEMPMHRWANLPEARLITQLAIESAGRVEEMAARQTPSAAGYVPAEGTIAELRDAVVSCQACDLCEQATQPVFGEGAEQARILIAGEQPGDEEDRAGRPFVGPAGAILDEALRAAGLDRRDLYVTNAVKAFKFEERGKRRIHQTPRSRDIAVCRPWLAAEIRAVAPRVVVCLGATAAQSVLGRAVRIQSERGRPIRQEEDRTVIVTYHPAAILRAPDPEMAKRQMEQLIADLRLARDASVTPPPSGPSEP